MTIFLCRFIGILKSRLWVDPPPPQSHKWSGELQSPAFYATVDKFMLNFSLLYSYQLLLFDKIDGCLHDEEKMLHSVQMDIAILGSSLMAGFDETFSWLH